MPLPRLNIFEKMRGIFTPIIEIRRKVLSEVAKMIAEGKATNYIETIPYNIISKNTPTYRDCVFHERAVVRERIRLAFGLDLKEFGAHGPIIDDIKPTLIDKKFINPPIVNVIKTGCERCPENSYFVSNLCKGCIAHPCISVCPKKAVSIIEGKSHIDQEACIKCGRCAQVCPYNAIVYRERPCATACGVGAITSDLEGFADIDYQKCVSCGLCIVSCPFGAIAEKSEIVQVLIALKSSDHVYAEIAPSFVSQFGPLVRPEMLFGALKKLGIKEIIEVAYGADVAILKESQELINILEKKEQKGNPLRKFVGTSCCPAWVLAAKKNYPDLANNISESYTPMVEAAKCIKQKDPQAKIIFIGPCISKKIECFNPLVAEMVDFVITFEELAALFFANNIDPATITETRVIQDASSLGRMFPVAKGVSSAIIKTIKNKYSIKEIPFQTADTLKECLELLKKVHLNQIDPYPLLIEGMACPFGCVGGPGTLAPLKLAEIDVKKFAEKAQWSDPQILE